MHTFQVCVLITGTNYQEVQYLKNKKKKDEKKKNKAKYKFTFGRGKSSFSSVSEDLFILYPSLSLGL